MFKRLTALLLAVVFLFSLAAESQAAAAPVKVWIGDEEIQFGDKGPIIANSTTLVPARSMMEKMGYSVAWDGESKTVHASREKVALSFTIGEAAATYNGQQIVLPTAIKIVDGTAYAPLRMIGEAAGYQVRWNGEARTATLVQSKGFFWKVEKDGAKVYLLGSIHVGNEYLYPIRQEIEAAFNEANKLVVEVNVAKAVTEELANRIASYMKYNDGSKLQDHIDKDTYNKLQAILKGIKAPENAFDPFKPWQVVNELTIIKAALSGYQPGLGIDAYYLQRAMKAGLPIEELESFEKQLAMLDGLSEELQIQMLQEAAAEFDAKDNSVALLAELWTSGSDEGLMKWLTEMYKQKEFYEAVIQNRNIEMTNKITDYLNAKENGTSFVIAGYLHMLGDHGIVTLLKEQGYTVTRL